MSKINALWFDPYIPDEIVGDFAYYFAKVFGITIYYCSKLDELKQNLDLILFSFIVIDPMVLDNYSSLKVIERSIKNSISTPLIIISANVEKISEDKYLHENFCINSTFFKPVDFLLLEAAIKEIIVNLENKAVANSKSGIVVIENSISVINRSLIDIVLKDPEIIYKISPRQFEELVAELFEKQGYIVKLTAETRDGGIDILAYKKDILDGAIYGIECKRYNPNNKIGRPTLQKLIGAIEGTRLTGGILATTSYFTREAQEYSEPMNHRLFLKDYDTISKLIEENK